MQGFEETLFRLSTMRLRWKGRMEKKATEDEVLSKVQQLEEARQQQKESKITLTSVQPR